jgi:nitroreductase
MTNQGVTRRQQSEIVDTLLARRSIREGFSDARVPREDIETILECGRRAASSKNAQPWRMHVVTSAPVIRGIARDVESSRNAAKFVPHDPVTGQPREWASTVVESAAVLRQVPLAIFIENTGEFCRDRKSVAAAGQGVRESALVGYGIEMLSHGLAIGAMMTCAMALGLSGVIMGDVLAAEKQIRERLGFEGDLVCVLALGYSDEPPYPKTLKDLSETVVYHIDDLEAS